MFALIRSVRNQSTRVIRSYEMCVVPFSIYVRLLFRLRACMRVCVCVCGCLFDASKGRAQNPSQACGQLHAYTRMNVFNVHIETDVYTEHIHFFLLCHVHGVQQQLSFKSAHIEGPHIHYIDFTSEKI